MIKLYQFARTWGNPNLGQFNVKLETYLRMAGIPYEIVETMPLTAPKGKLPYIEDNGTKIADSEFIIEHLKEHHGDPLDASLSDRQKATGLAVMRLLEDHLYWAGMYSRWLYTDENWRINKQAIFGGMPPVVRDLAAWIYRRRVIARQIHGMGFGRHSAEEVFHLGIKDLDALAALLGEQPYLLGDQPSSYDASMFGVLVNTIDCPIESPLKEHGRKKRNLLDYCARIRQRYFPELCDS